MNKETLLLRLVNSKKDVPIRRWLVGKKAGG